MKEKRVSEQLWKEKMAEFSFAKVGHTPGGVGK